MADPMKSPDRDAADELLLYLREQVAAAVRGNAGLIVLSVARAEQFIVQASELATLRRRDEQGWLIEVAESGQESAGGPIYWCGPGTWFRDHSLAIRFARREDAERVMPMAEEERRKTLHAQERLIAVQHGWASPLPPGRNEG